MGELVISKCCQKSVKLWLHLISCFIVIKHVYTYTMRIHMTVIGFFFLLKNYKIMYDTFLVTCVMCVK